ncbi:hypothetical protein JB92DRAFT_3138291 [Gautieria morchelliformis]|nr:hypothetical protein JB92DRAFT_3138291 [Gautieria morchelliformis]
MPRASGGNDPIKKYQTEPPPWLIPSHSIADLGYHGFHPPRRHQEEDLLSDHNVKHGYSATHTIGAEYYSSQATIRDRIVNHKALSELDDLMNQVLARRSESHSNIPEHAFKLPQRITLSEVRRQSWHTDFFNPEVPLHTIGEKIPHAKGHDLLTLLQENKVPISRAVWYVRGLGGNETQGMRNRPNYNPAQYSVEWANVVTSYLKKLLAEIGLPSAARTGLNIKQTFKGILNDPELRDKWLSKFCYCLDLLREFYAESLVDHSTFLSWLAQQLTISNLAQANFVARIADEYLDGMLPYRGLQRAMIDGCLAKHSEIQTTTGSHHLTSLATALSSLLQRMFIHNPDSFVNPKNWVLYAPSITQILKDSPTSTAADRNEWVAVIENDLADVARRNDALLFRIIPERATATAKFTMNDVKLLNSITDASDMAKVNILDMRLEDTDAFTNKLDMLLTWSITRHQYGDHRPYAVATLLSQWVDNSEDRALRRGLPPPDEMLQDRLFDWIDTSKAITDAANLAAMSVMFGELIGCGIFSYSKYIQRLIARGEKGLRADEAPPSRHRPLLRSLPLVYPSPSLANQRKVALYGISYRVSPEESKEKDLRCLLRACLPELFGGAPLPMDHTLPLDMQVLICTSRYEQVRVLRHWFWPIFEKHLQQSSKHDEVLNLQTYVSLMHIMTLVKAYRTMLDINLKLLACITSPELLGAIIDTFRRHADIWTCMNAHGRLLAALCASHEAWNWSTRRAQSRPLLCLLIEFVGRPNMPQAAKDRVNDDAMALMQGLRPPNSPTQPSMFSRIGMLAQENDTSLATNIWMRHGFAANWVQEVWQNTLECLRELPAAETDVEERDVRILRYAQFLWDIDQHLLPGALDQLVFHWAVGPGRTEFRRLSSDVWSALSTVLLYLVARDALTAPNVMKGVVFPSWELCTTLTGPSASIILSPVNRIASHLLVHDQKDPAATSSEQIDENQKFQTRRRAIYAEENFSLLVTALPNLVTLENKDDIDDNLRNSIAHLRTAISKHPKFRMVAYRNLELVSRAFWNVDAQSLPQNVERHLGNALQQILSDSEPWVLQINAFDWRTLSSFLSPWRYSRTAIELQLALRSLGAGLRDDATKDQARKDLWEFGSSFFGQSLTSEETDLIADMLRGISGVVACTLINSGMQRMTQLFRDLTDLTWSIAQPLLHNAGEALYLMSSILQPLHADSAGLPNLEADVQDAFVCSLRPATRRLDEFCASNQVPGVVTDLVVVVARLWQFDVCLPGAWTPQLREAAPDVLANIIRLAAKYSSGILTNSVVFDVLIDTAFLLFDEIPRDGKVSNTDLFQHVAGVDIGELPRDISGVNRRRLASLLAYVPDDTAVTNLVHAWHTASGEIVFGPEVQNNPWEWAESIEPSVSTSTLGRDKPELRNSSSIPLEVFGTRPTGEHVFGELALPGGGRGRDAAAARQLEDGLAADNVFERDWRETRVDWKADLFAAEEYGGGGGGAQEQDQDDGAAGAGEHRAIKQETPYEMQLAAGASGSGSTGTGTGTGSGTGASPAPTVRSQRSSAAQRAGSVPSTSSRGRSSGAHGGGGDGDRDRDPSVPESADTHTRGSKRKEASPASLDLEPPAAAARGAGAGRRGRGRGANSGRGKGKKK